MFPYNTLYQYHNIWTYNSRLCYNLRITNTSTVATESRLSMPAMPAKTRSKCTMDRQEGNSAMQSLGVHLRRLNEGIKKLQELNINTTLSSLPKYAVVGDQSAGKSSIVQALCGISLPRSSGTTTRCPFLITTRKETSSKETWTCKVSIKKQDYREDDRGKQCDVLESQVTRFATITDIADLEDTLRRAQIAILNPREDPTRYATIDLTEHTPTTALFSKDIICLDISAPNLPELMFYDLPGCINVYDMPKSVLSDLKQQQDEERDLIDMITSTVTSYIRDEKCLLLLACSADQDVEMSLTMKYIRQHSAEDRCIGVFAKADLVASTRLKNVQDILSGDKYELGKGWFVTKQLSQQEIDDGVDFDSGRVREKDLFATAPWTECLSLHDRYGMFNLQDEIASSLASHIFSE
jgi:GTPase SAR1 family protein